jgi:hypothetical protein
MITRRKIVIYNQILQLKNVIYNYFSIVKLDYNFFILMDA